MDVKAEVEKLDATIKDLKKDTKRGHESTQEEVRRLDATFKELDKNTKSGHESTQEEVQRLIDTIKELDKDMKRGHESTQEDVQRLRDEVRQSHRPELASSPQHENEFDNIHRPQERIQGSLTIRNTRTKTPRPPPTAVYHRNFQLCKWWKSGRVCKYGRGCTYAHGNAELRSWMGYYKKENQEIRGEEEYCPYAHGDDELTSWMGHEKENQEITSEVESSYQNPEKNADIARSEVQIQTVGGYFYKFYKFECFMN
ncbi:hypothetical protein OS493_023643 [Desmophyllum pertusum]|uniref:C3H1-type domain-containing protein n=1 Tax=Desmophyllum pertusum TaxID=174260 RepID=A0A9X0CXW0_9CNID|nr:hypothetical protein OS493_023643 [Desmophyllum pertusum]